MLQVVQNWGWRLFFLMCCAAGCRSERAAVSFTRVASTRSDASHRSLSAFRAENPSSACLSGGQLRPTPPAISSDDKAEPAKPACPAALAKLSSAPRAAGYRPPRPARAAIDTKLRRYAAPVWRKNHGPHLNIAARDEPQLSRGGRIGTLFLAGALLTAIGGISLGLELSGFAGIFTFLGALVLGLLLAFAALSVAIAHDNGRKYRVNSATALVTVAGLSLAAFSLASNIPSVGLRLLLLGLGITVSGFGILQGIPDTP